MGRALERVQQEAKEMEGAFDGAAGEGGDEQMQLLASTTKEWICELHHEISKVKLELMAERQMKDRSFTGEGARGLNATVGIQLNYGNVFKSNANKNVMLIVAGSNHWETEQTFMTELRESQRNLVVSKRSESMASANALVEAGNENSYYGVFRDLTSDEDGRIFKTLERGKGPSRGTLAGMKPQLYNVRVAVPNDHTTGSGNLFLLKPGTPCVVFDCDGTLTTGDEEVVKQFFLSTVGLDDLYDPKMQPGASACCRMWASKGYQCVYL